MLIHVDGTLRLPVAESIASTHDGQTLEEAQLWCANLDADGLCIFGLRTHLALAGCYTLCEGRRIEKCIFGDVDPVIVGGIACTLGGYEFQAMGYREPFTTRLLVTTHHTVVIVHVCIGLHGLTQLAHPVAPVKRAHLVLFCLTIQKDVYCQFFSERGLVFKIQYDSHNAFSYFNCLGQSYEIFRLGVFQVTCYCPFVNANVCMMTDCQDIKRNPESFLTRGDDYCRCVGVISIPMTGCSSLVACSC